jgi:hypothetical protein
MATKKVERAVTFEHADGVLVFKVATVGELRLVIGNTSEQAKVQAVVFGFARKVTNAAALDAGSTNQEKYDAMADVVAHLNGGGDWNQGRAKGEGAGGESGLVVLALQRVYGDTPAKAEATIEKTMAKKGIDRKAALKLWAGTDKIAAAIAEIKAERASAKAKAANVDADELLEELED